MEIKAKELKLIFLPGTTLEEAIKEAKAFSIKYRTDVRAVFNTRTHTITAFTNEKELNENWYK